MSINMNTNQEMLKDSLVSEWYNATTSGNRLDTIPLVTNWLNSYLKSNSNQRKSLADAFISFYVKDNCCKSADCRCALTEAATDILVFSGLPAWQPLMPYATATKEAYLHRIFKRLARLVNKEPTLLTSQAIDVYLEQILDGKRLLSEFTYSEIRERLKTLDIIDEKIQGNCNTAEFLDSNRVRNDVLIAFNNLAMQMHKVSFLVNTIIVENWSSSTRAAYNSLWIDLRAKGYLGISPEALVLDQKEFIKAVKNSKKEFTDPLFDDLTLLVAGPSYAFRKGFHTESKLPYDYSEGMALRSKLYNLVVEDLQIACSLYGRVDEDIELRHKQNRERINNKLGFELTNNELIKVPDLARRCGVNPSRRAPVQKVEEPHNLVNPLKVVMDFYDSHNYLPRAKDLGDKLWDVEQSIVTNSLADDYAGWIAAISDAKGLKVGAISENEARFNRISDALHQLGNLGVYRLGHQRQFRHKELGLKSIDFVDIYKVGKKTVTFYVEVDGEQHFKPVFNWYKSGDGAAENRFKRQQKYDKAKARFVDRQNSQGNLSVFISIHHGALKSLNVTKWAEIIKKVVSSKEPWVYLKDSTCSELKASPKPINKWRSFDQLDAYTYKKA